VTAAMQKSRSAIEARGKASAHLCNDAMYRDGRNFIWLRKMSPCMMIRKKIQYGSATVVAIEKWAKATFKAALEND